MAQRVQAAEWGGGGGAFLNRKSSDRRKKTTGLKSCVSAVPLQLQDRPEMFGGLVKEEFLAFFGGERQI